MSLLIRKYVIAIGLFLPAAILPLQAQDYANDSAFDLSLNGAWVGSANPNGGSGSAGEALFQSGHSGVTNPSGSVTNFTLGSSVTWTELYTNTWKTGGTSGTTVPITINTTGSTTYTTLTLNGNSGQGAIINVQTSVGNLNVGAAQTWSGTAAFNLNGALGGSSLVTLNNNTGGVNINAADYFSGGFTLTNGSVLNYNNGSNANNSGALSITNSTVTISNTAANGFGVTTLSGGTLTANSSNSNSDSFTSISLASASTATFNNSTTSGAVNFYGNVGVSGGSTLAMNNGGANAFNGTTSVSGTSSALTLNNGTQTNTFSNATSVSSGGTLTIANNGTNSFNGITLSGGTLAITGNSTNNDGTLTLSSNSTIALGTSASGTLKLSTLSIGSGSVLTVTGWQGPVGANGVDGRIFASSSGLTTGTIVSDVVFDLSTNTHGASSQTNNNGIGNTIPGFNLTTNPALANSSYDYGEWIASGIAGYDELVPYYGPVPEPATIFGGALFLAFVAWRERRRLSKLVAPLL